MNFTVEDIEEDSLLKPIKKAVKRKELRIRFAFLEIYLTFWYQVALLGHIFTGQEVKVTILKHIDLFCMATIFLSLFGIMNLWLLCSLTSFIFPMLIIPMEQLEQDHSKLSSFRKMR